MDVYPVIRFEWCKVYSVIILLAYFPKCDIFGWNFLYLYSFVGNLFHIQNLIT